uniref:Putative salivary lipocalin lipocalin n=1 Tax=Amblyomma tuberculatum TaxID=48802 RepID=A0A6M2E4W1_9ACAR
MTGVTWVFAIAVPMFLRTGFAITEETCDAGGGNIVSHFQHGPDAGQLMESMKKFYCLVYHSKNSSFGIEMPCLCARASLIEVPGEHAKYLYQFSPNQTLLLSGVTLVRTHRTDRAFKHKNEIIASYVRDWEKYEETFRILYTDYNSCVVFSSTGLGVQLWVRRQLLLEEKAMPYLCSLTYDLATKDAGVRHMVYDWKQCPERRSYKEQLDRDS